MQKTTYSIVVVVMLSSILLFASINSSHAQINDEEFYKDYEYEGNNNYQGYSNYDNGKYNDYKEYQKPSVKINKEVFLCDGGEGFCFNTDNLQFNFNQFVSCADNPQACQQAGITESDFQIDVLHSFKGSAEPIKFNFGSTDYRVTEEFLVPGLGDIACFFVGKETGQLFERGGFIETESGKVLFVCNNFEGECSGSLDDKYAVNKQCTVNNYVITAFEGPMQDRVTEMGQILTSQIPMLSNLNDMMEALGGANAFSGIFK